MMVTPMKELTGRHVLITLLVFFAVVFAVNGIFIYVALTTDNPRDSEGAYERGRLYNQLIQAEREQNALGWTYKVALPDNHTVSISFTDKNGGPVKGLKVRGEVGRKATDHFTQDITLAETQPGVYSTAIKELDPGAWIVVLTAFANEGEKERAVYRVKEIQWLTPKS
jgi:nitrogen fixation protein FixH